MDRRTFIQSGISVSLLASLAASCENLSGECTENCENLYKYHIINELCTACGNCLDQCGKNAIDLEGSPNRVEIDQNICVHCGACFLVCEYNSVIETDGTGIFNFDYHINQDTCVQCLECYDKCREAPQPGAIVQSNPDNRSRINQLKCSHCGECVELEFCLFGAINEKK
ncbi:4Fe-4S binding protein [Myxococcota bacterium]|nr:4Fe-4S binding protein [Myxococcota bacterium]MBU1381436.1 4Fe-4S binding protein [Myxococcota bacterium]MBU1496591.1 4Fe-4S binding protein [Myxococcota bacterium]